MPPLWTSLYERIAAANPGYGSKHRPVTLHVGLGTFRPVKVDDVEKHHMHSEFYVVEEEQAKLINDTKKWDLSDFCGATSPAARGILESCHR